LNNWYRCLKAHAVILESLKVLHPYNSRDKAIWKILFIVWIHDNYDTSDWRRRQIEGERHGNITQYAKANVVAIISNTLPKSNFTRQFDTVLYISDLTIFNVNRIHPSQTHVTEVVVLQYSDHGSLGSVVSVTKLIGVVLSPAHRTVMIVQSIKSLLIFHASCRTENLLVGWNSTARYLLLFLYFDSTLNFRRLALIATRLFFALDR